MSKEIVHALKQMGKAEMKLWDVYKSDLFELTRSKHSYDQFKQKYEGEKLYDLFYEIRGIACMIEESHNLLWDEGRDE